MHDRLPRTDGLVVDAAEGHDGRAHSFGAETGEGLRESAFNESGDGEHLGGRDNALAAPPVDSYLHGVVREASDWPSQVVENARRCGYLAQVWVIFRRVEKTKPCLIGKTVARSVGAADL